MHRHTVIVPNNLLHEYLEERRETICKAQDYLSRQKSKWIIKQFIYCVGLVVGITLLIIFA